MLRRLIVVAFLAVVAGCGLNPAATTTTGSVPTERPTTTTTSSTAPPTTTTTTTTTTTSLPLPDPVPIDPEAVAPDNPAGFLPEIEHLRMSARPGRLVGFVQLTGEASTGILNDRQPFCHGAGRFRDVVPGTKVIVIGSNEHETVLRGSVFDGPIGCGLWFGVDVEEADRYTVRIGSHEVAFETDELDATDWLITLWTDPIKLDIECTHGLIPIEQCRLLDPAD